LTQSGKRINKLTVIEELAARGHKRADVEKYYSLMDLNIPMLEIKSERFIEGLMSQTDAESENEKGEDMLEDPKAITYMGLEESEQEKVKAIQKDYKQHVKEVVQIRLKAPEIVKMMRETEKQLDFKDGSLGLTAEDLEEKID
jgi:hypothetical protein